MSAPPRELATAPAPGHTLHPTHPGVPPFAERAGWAPWSPCGPDCLPAAGPTAHLRVARRLAVLLGVLVAAPLLLVPARPTLYRLLLRAAGVRVRVEGTLGRGGLVVANHLSWVDVLALGVLAPVRMVAKAEVAHWPLIGPLAARTGALFVERARLRGLPGVVAATAAVLRAGDTVGVFPEGTTWCGSASGPFRRAPFQAALDAGVPVRPVRITMTLPDGRPTTAGSFLGDETLATALLRVLRLPRLHCTLTVLAPLAPTGDRRDLAARAERAIAG
ncbi:1-acyl-sn-glycerol-3-phosphate acyltransferase [Pseudonocardia sp. WMMC193]|uniref:lysophospholipid acyltransferase family protein n=1 Tax=Pseudonocardia sp. WMMC193 TaxID=2911965 RepID=UPI001F44462E|nr:lysophospholipid acyltransferase family protein [Pseudonocardia sp. WMMC193]MCF7550310.1 1-acyl-sn-glycerol-3-phosphate acyltransferase [Pseudonocardia sp. WMMC193]